MATMTCDYVLKLPMKKIFIVFRKKRFIIMQKINDFGKKIGGAKKDLWKERNMIFEDTIEMTEAEKRKYVKRDNIWKKIDTEELLEKGYPRLIVFWLKEMRACIYPDMKRTYISIKDTSRQSKRFEILL